VALCEKGATDSPIVQECGTIHAFHGDRALHVTKLPDVIVALVNRGPAEQRIAHGLQGLLVFDDALSLMRVPRGVAVDKRRHARSPGLLQLEEERVLWAAALEQHNEGSETHTAHTDYFVSQIYYHVQAEHPVPVLRKSCEISLQSVDETVLLLIGCVRDEGRLVHDKAHAIVLAGQLG
jgi:hypothetical protein